MPTLEINAGKGLTFDGNKLTANWATDDPAPVEITEDGVIIPDLKGDPGPASGTTADGVSVIERSSRIQTNPSVVEYIFSMCAYKCINRGAPKDYAVDETRAKTIDDIIHEMNAIKRYNGKNMSTYYMQTNQLLLLRQQYHASRLSGWTESVDDGNRWFGDKAVALFIIRDVKHSSSSYSSFFTTSLTLQCIWVTDPEDDPVVASAFTKGGIYTGTDSI